MSSLSQVKNGSWRLQITCPVGKRRDVYFRTNKKNALMLQRKIDEIAQCKKLHEPMDVKTSVWLSQQDEAILAKLEKLQLYKLTRCSKAKGTIAGWSDFYIEEFGHRSETKRKLRNVAEKLIAFFGKDRLLQDITSGEAVRFFVTLCRSKTEGGFGLSEHATAPRHLGYCRQFWEAAIDEGLVVSNPFKNRNLSVRVKTNKERHFYVDPELSCKIIEAMPNLVWRLRWTLMRYQGLRVPSEMNVLRWGDVDWAGGRIRIQSPKTAHIHGKASRLAAIMPEVLPYLEQMFNEVEPGSEYVLPRLSHKNYRKSFLRLLNVSGIDPWPALFNNLRKSAVTDAHDWLPSHVCNAWFGHSETIFRNHYGQVTEEHFREALRRIPSTPQITPQITPQQTSESGENAGNKNKKDSEQNAQSPFLIEGNGRDQKSEEINDSSKWAMRDSNPDEENS